MKIPLVIAACGVAIIAAIFAAADTSRSGTRAGRPETVDPISGVIIPAQPAGGDDDFATVNGPVDRSSGIASR